MENATRIRELKELRKDLVDQIRKVDRMLELLQLHPETKIYTHEAKPGDPKPRLDRDRKIGNLHIDEEK